MTQDEFDNLVIGDEISHAICPWAIFIVVQPIHDGGWYLVRVNSAGVAETGQCRTPKEWILISRILKREYIDTQGT